MRSKISYDLLVQSFKSKVATSAEAHDIWNDERRFAPWTEYASKVFANALQHEFRLEACCKGKPDIDKRSEYLGLDVCGYEKDAWGPLIVAIEIENYYSRIQYSAWKLLSVIADIRLLLCYYNSKSINDTICHSKDDVNQAIMEVAASHPTRRLHVLCADASEYINEDNSSDFFEDFAIETIMKEGGKTP